MSDPLFPIPRERCDGDLRLVLANGVEITMHDLSPEQVIVWRFGWSVEVVKVQYPLPCNDPVIHQRSHFDDVHTWMHQRWERTLDDGNRHSVMITAVVRRDGSQRMELERI